MGSGKTKNSNPISTDKGKAAATVFPIYEILPTGRSNGISARELKRLVGCENDRNLRLLIHQERKAGAMICSSSTGYYKPEDRSEIAEFVKSLESMAMNILIAIRPARRALQDMGETPEMQGAKEPLELGGQNE